MTLFLSIGEAMAELSPAADGMWRLGLAGDTLNTAWYTRASLPVGWRVSYLTRVGEDPFSHLLLKFLTDNGIESDFVRVQPGGNLGVYAISLDGGERSFTYWRGQSAARGLARDAVLLDEAFAEAGVIYLSGITLAILPPEDRVRVIDRMARTRAAGKITAFDPNIRPRLWEDPQIMCRTLMSAGAAASHVLPSFDDEAVHFGDPSITACAQRWLAAGAGEVVVKNGGGPILWAQGGETQAYHVTREVPLDSTGAGDAFNGAWLAARLAGHAPLAAAEAGHALSRRVIATPGALIPMEILRGA